MRKSIPLPEFKEYDEDSRSASISIRVPVRVKQKFERLKKEKGKRSAIEATAKWIENLADAALDSTKGGNHGQEAS
jgi:predicted DNA-binding protein